MMMKMSPFYAPSLSKPSKTAAQREWSQAQTSTTQVKKCLNEH